MKTQAPDYVQMYLDYNFSVPLATVDVWGEISEESVSGLVQGIRIIEASSDKPPLLTVNLCTTGGDYYSGMALYNAIKHYRGPTRCVVSGSCQSMGAIILMAGKERWAYTGSTILLHDGSTSIDGEASAVKSYVTHQTDIDDFCHKLFASRSKQKAKFWKDKLKSDFYLTSEQALKLGLIDKVI